MEKTSTFESDLTDLSDLSLSDLDELAGTALAGELARIIHDAKQPEQVVAGFASSI